MTRKGLLKFGFFGILIVIFFVFCFNLIFISPSSFAQETIDSYQLGERVKIDLRGFFDYKLKIVSPSQSFIQKGNDNVFIYKPIESGTYFISVESSDKNYSYSFEVLFNLPETNISLNSSLNDSIENNFTFWDESGSDILDSDLIEKIPANLEIFSSNEVPFFEFDETELKLGEAIEGNLVDSFFELFSSNKPKVRIESFNGESRNIKSKEYDVNGPVSFSLSEVDSLTPGLNKVVFQFSKDEETYFVEKWFIWGVLAVNFDKSIYFNEENSFISLGVLSETGQIICDAYLELEITSPSEIKTVLSTSDGGVQLSSTCGYLGALSMPDYFANYQVHEIGTYNVLVKSLTDNGEYSIEDSFEVRDKINFDVRRSAPTRVYPYLDYEMRFYLRPYQNYTGPIVERLPLGFEVTPDPAFDLEYSDDEIILRWDVDLIEEENYEFSYEFNTPDVIPALYLLGPLSIGNFSELRRWQIANDPEYTIDSSIATSDQQYGTGASVVFLNDTTGYAFYFDSGPQLSYVKTNDSGVTWGSPVSVTSQTDAYTFAIWYDRWTPNYNGNLINIIFGETGGDAFYYKYLNTTGDTLSTEVAATGDLGRLREQAQNPSIVRSSLGNLFFSGADDNSGNEDIWKSTNNGSSWASTSGSAFNNDFDDEFALIPIAGGDIFAIHSDNSASDLIARRYNESTDSWIAGTTIDATFASSTTNELEASWGATVDPNTSLIYVVGNNDPGAAGADIQSYFFNGTGWNVRTDVYTNIGAAGRGAKVSFGSNNKTVYATYTRAPGGTATSSDVYYVSSIDNMTTWSSETIISTTQDDLAHPRPDLVNPYRLYAAWVNIDLTSFLGNTIFTTTIPPEVTSLTNSYFSSSSVTSVSVSPINYTRFILGWCDDTDEDIIVALYYTNGTGIKRTVDSTAGACTAKGVGKSVGVSALDKDRFVIAWYDSVDADVTYQIYNLSLSNLTAQIDADTDVGTSAAVSVSALNSTSFVLGWYDFTDQDSTFGVYSSNGGTITSATDVDTTAGAASHGVDVSALNSTSFVFAWFDDIDNDASLQTYSYSGSSIAPVFDADGGAGESRVVSVSAFNSTSIVFAWFDAATTDASYRIHLWNSTPISAGLDSDADVGTTRSLEVSSVSQGIFAMDWYDASTDTGIAAQTFRANTTSLSSEVSVQSASLQYADIASRQHASGIEICDDAFIVAMVNTTSQSFWRAYYSNGTVWNGTCSNNFPVISNVNVSSITAFTAFVNWTTDVLADSTINYGITNSLGNVLVNGVTNNVHSFNLTGLSAGQTYYFNVTSCIDWRCNTTGPYTFSTGIGNPAPAFGQPVSSQIWTNGTNVRYILNFTNNGTVSSNYTLNVTNISGAYYVNINQSSFSNINNGTTVFFELNLSSMINGTYFVSLNVTSLLDTTKTDGLSLGTIFLNPNVYSNNSVTSVSNAPLGYDEIVVAWCDDTEDDISFGVFNTTGYLLTQITDVDTTAGACSANGAGHSVSVSSLDEDRFVIAWYDSIDSDTSFQIFYSNGSAVNSVTDLDTDATSSLTVSVTSLNSTAFVASWFDDTSNDISAAVYSSSGNTITSIFDIDTDVGELAQAVEVSAVNSTAFGVTYFDDSGGGAGLNDIYYALYSYTGAIISSVITVDSNAGNSRSTSVAVMNQSSLVVAWVDVNDGAKQFAIYYPNGTTRVAQTTIDTDSTGGEDIRVSAITQDDFVVSWYDPTTDTGTYTQTYRNNGTLISSAITVQSSSLQYNDVASEQFANQIQLCEDAYVVAFVNTTSQALWKSYYPNGTIWNGICPTYVPQISNVNVSNIAITSAFVNWTTDVEANSTINYGTTQSLGFSSSNNFPRTLHGFNLTGLSGQTIYYFNVTSCKDGRCNTTGTHSFMTSTVDAVSPLISLVFPSNGSTISSPFDYYFVYNVTDSSSISNCSLYINGTLVQTRNSISSNVNQTFYHYLENGTYLWAVSCTDQYSNFNITSNRTITVNTSPWSFSRRFYETYTSNGIQNQTAVIRLNNSQDSTQNTVGFNITAQTLRNIVNASTQVMGANGAIIPSGSIVDFSSSFSLSSANVVLTWKLYISNSSGETLLCQNGDDSSGGTVTAGTATGQNTSCISSQIRLMPSDRITYVINAFNTHATQLRSIIHAWDSPTSSFVDLNVSTEGFLNVNLVSPLIDSSISTGQQINATCQVYCSVGTCRNTQVYIQSNTSSTNWSNVSSSGNIILFAGETNPHSLGNLSTTMINTTFSLQGNLNSINNLRCLAVSSYDSEIGSTTKQITVGQSDVAPVISLTNPSNATWYNAPNVTVFYNITDLNSNVINSTLILNGVRNTTNSTSINLGQINNFTLVNLQSGSYLWTVNATDSTNLEGTNTSTRIFYVDTQRPSINLTAPANNTAFQVNSVQFNYTVFDNMDTSLVCNLTIDGSFSYSNVNSPNGTLNNLTVSSISVGTHYWNVSCIDEAGNLNNSVTRTFVIQDIAPTVDLITANATYSTSGNITLIYNVTDNNGILYTRLILNGQINQTNTSAILNGQYNNFTVLRLAEGNYNWNINATDTGGLNSTNHSSRTFIVDLNAPNIILNLPANNSVSNSSTVDFNFTATDSIDTSLTCNLYVGDRSDLLFSAANGTLVNRQITNFIDGEFYWNVSCMDDAGLMNYTQNRLINITEYPRITLNTANNSFFNTTSFNLSYTPNDNTNLSLCELYIDGLYNQTQTTPSNGLQSNFSVIGMSSGAHNWYVSCNDTYGLRNYTQNRTFTVDTNGLTVDLIYPNNDSQFFTLNLNLSFNATDNIDPFLLCNITVNNVVVNTSLAPSGTIVNRSVTFSSGGIKYWNVTCVDDANNFVTSLTRNFSIEQAPGVGLVSPLNNTYSNDSIISFVYSVLDDNNNIANATLILNGVRNQTNLTEVINDAENNITLSLPDGFYNWTINVTDLTNLVGTEIPYRVLTVDTKMPWIDLNYPPNNTLFDTNNITLNYTAYDLIDGNLTCNVTIDGATVFPNLDSLNGTSITNYVSRSDGTYTWDVNCRDDANNLNYSETRTFFVEAPPIVTLLDPINEEYLNTSNLNLVYLPQDAIGIFNCSLFLDGVFNTSSGTITSNVNNSFNVNNVLEGRHNWSVACTDVFPDFNLGVSNTTNFTVDITYPQISLNLPINGSNTLRLVGFNFTAIDNIDENLTCNLYTDNVLNISSINASNGTSVLQNINRFSLGSHTWNVSCMDDAGNRNWSSRFSFNVTLADFMVNYSDIVFNMSNPAENDTVNVNVTVHNLINVTVPNVSVSFFQGQPGAGGIQLGPNYTLYDIAGLSDRVLSINWSVPLGTNQIYVHIDPPISSNGSIVEWNETNNAANNSATVSGWQFVYGDINEFSFFKLEDQDNNSVILWQAANLTDGRIYVSDSESSISWYYVYGLGFNLSGSISSNDFSDLDTLLGMGSFGDSVYNTYTNSGTPTNLSNLFVFNRLVTGIPFANSTNNTNFMTGILWDGSDDLVDGQFSQEDKEDVLFMTYVNKDKPGAYGTYDYEIRIPAKLREYFTSQANKVVFYTEVL